MSAASESVGASGGGGGDGDGEQEFEIRIDDDFVYKVPRGLYPDAAPSTTQPAAGPDPDPEAAGLRRRRRALLRLRDKRLRDLSRWEALASEFLAPLPAPQPPASFSDPVAAAASSSSSPPVAAAAASILDDFLVQLDLRMELMKKARQWCEEANAECDTGEAAIVESIAPLGFWGRDPWELMAGLSCPSASCTPLAGLSSPAASSPAPSGVLTAGFSTPAASAVPRAESCSPAAGSLDGDNGRQEASGVSAAVPAKTMKSSTKKQKVGHDLPPILTESRMRRRVSGCRKVAPEAPIELKRKKASRSIFTTPGTPGSTRSKANSTPARAPFIVGSPGALTRRRAAEAAKNESPEGS